jgi:hypothetical protein
LINLASLANNALVMNSLESEQEKLNIKEIDMKSKNHKPTQDTGQIKLGRVISSLLPEIEDLEKDIY